MLDLLGRKVLGRGQGNLLIFFGEIDTTLTALRSDTALGSLCDRLAALKVLISDTARQVARNMEEKGKSRALGHASSFLNAFGHFVVAWLWLRSAFAARSAGADAEFIEGKLAACHFFFDHELPHAEMWLQSAAEEARLLDDLNVEAL